MYSNKQIDPRFFYQKPKPRFGEILNANHVIPRDINKDLMTHTNKISEVKNLSKHYPHRAPAKLGYKPPVYLQKY